MRPCRRAGGRDGGWRRWTVAGRAAACALAALFMLAAPPSGALDSQRSILQYAHTRWTASEGAPAGITGITQSRDGYLWLSAYAGLFRFDGITFERIDPKADQMTDGSPWRVFTSRNGDVWTYYPDSKRFAVYRGGRLHTVPAPRPEGTVLAFAETPDGAIWVAGGQIGQPMLRYFRGKWAKLQPDKSYGRDTNAGMVVTADGTLWVAYSNNVFRWPLGGTAFQHMLSDPGARMKLSLDPAGRVWVTGVGGSRPITEAGGRWMGRSVRFRYPSDNSPRRGITMFDRDGNLWVARRKDGLEWLRKPSPAGPAGPAAPPVEYRSRDGLTSNAVYSIFEDREGNIWVGTTLGLDRFRTADIVREPELDQTAAFGDILFADSDGNVFVGQRNAVYRVEPRGVPRPILTGVNEPEAICEGVNGSIWIALADHIAVLDGSRRSRVKKPAGLETGVKDCGLDRWGRLWVSGERSGLYLRTPAGWSRVPVKASAAFRPGQMEHDRRGDLWVNGGPAGLVRVDPDGPAVVRPASTDKLEDIRTISPAGDGLLLAGAEGIGLLQRGRLAVAAVAQIGSLLGVNGVVQTAAGETWIFTRDGLTRMRTADLARAFRDSSFQIPSRTFDFLDGLIDSNSVRPPRAMVLAADGRLWASTATGIVWTDPARLTFNALPPRISIRSVEASGRRYRDPGALKLPSGSSSVTVEFAVLSLRIPERVRVRYRLEGQDEGWVDPGLRRQAFYTNLGPGNYRFQVMAANESGVWNQQGTTLVFSIAPTFAQSIWFKLLLALLLCALLAAAYILRLRQVTSRLQSRFDVRVAERERIARELHDTLLQGFQGLLLQFKAVSNRLPQESALRQSLERALVRAQQVLIEGRERVRDLRSEQDTPDLADALLRVASEQAPDEGPRVRLVQEGIARPLHPLVREELHRIVEECVRNAVSHAQPSAIEILLIWSRGGLRLAVRDDGTGIPASILERGEREGHYGLIGMRERAERIGATLAVTSRQSGGTEVALAVPAGAAYQEHVIGFRDRIRRAFA